MQASSYTQRLEVRPLPGPTIDLHCFCLCMVVFLLVLLMIFFRPAGANKRRTGKEVSEQHGNSLRVSELGKQSQSQPRMPVAVINCKEHIINIFFKVCKVRL